MNARPSFDALLRKHLGPLLRSDGFKVAGSRRYRRTVGDWTQEVHVERYKRTCGFFIEFSMAFRGVEGALSGRISEDGRTAEWGHWSETLEESFGKLACAYRERWSAVLHEMFSRFETVRAHEAKELGGTNALFFAGWSIWEWLAKVRLQQDRPAEALQFAKGVLEFSYLNDGHTAVARSIIDKIQNPELDFTDNSRQAVML